MIQRGCWKWVKCEISSLDCVIYTQEPVLPTTLSSGQMAEHPIIFAETNKESFIRIAGRTSQLKHNIAEQIAGNSLTPFLP